MHQEWKVKLGTQVKVAIEGVACTPKLRGVFASEKKAMVLPPYYPVLPLRQKIN